MRSPKKRQMARENVISSNPRADHFGTACLERAQYPKDYASDLQSGLDFATAPPGRGRGKDPMSLIRKLFEAKPTNKPMNSILKERNQKTLLTHQPRKR